jgi:hypothetical protein
MKETEKERKNATVVVSEAALSLLLRWALDHTGGKVLIGTVIVRVPPALLITYTSPGCCCLMLICGHGM